MNEQKVNKKSTLNESLQWFNVGLRGFMELSIVIGLGFWGFQAGTSLLFKILLSIFTPLIVFGFWGLVDFHHAGQLGEGLRLVQEITICGITVVALFSAGQPILAWIFGLIAIVQHGLVYLTGDTLLKQSQ